MRVTLVWSDGRRETARIAGDYVTIPACQACGTELPAIRGTGITHHDHDTYYAQAVAACCGAEMAMETKVDTLFGIEEDNAVLNGRARVYGR